MKKTEISDSFCILPWIHVHNWPSGKVTPCCIGDQSSPLGDLNKDTLQKIWHDSPYRELRRQFKEGEFPKQCEGCYKREKIGLISGRQDKNSKYAKEVERVAKEGFPLEPELNLKFVDFRFTNTCNLKCRTCSSQLSSSIESERKLFFNSYKTNVNNAFKILRALRITKIAYILGITHLIRFLYLVYLRVFNTHKNFHIFKDFKINIDKYLKNVEEVYFAGGEPLLMQEHYLMMKYFIERKMFDLEITYSTNVTILKQNDLYLPDEWKKFKKISILTSLDEMGSRAEYIRHGTNWLETQKNLKVLKELKKNVTLHNQITLSVLNIFKLTEFIDYLLSIETFSYIRINFVYGPENMQISVLPFQTRKNLAKEISNYFEENREILSRIVPDLEKVPKALMQDQTENRKMLNSFFKDMDRLDQVRGESLMKEIPELEPLLLKSED